jgi:hypothetical protein
VYQQHRSIVIACSWNALVALQRSSCWENPLALSVAHGLRLLREVLNPQKKIRSGSPRIHLLFVLEFPKFSQEHAKYKMTRAYSNMTEFKMILREEMKLRINSCITTPPYRRWSERRVAVSIAFDGRKAPVHDASSVGPEPGSSVEILFRGQPEKSLYPYRYRRSEIPQCCVEFFQTPLRNQEAVLRTVTTNNCFTSGRMLSAFLRQHCAAQVYRI